MDEAAHHRILEEQYQVLHAEDEQAKVESLDSDFMADLQGPQVSDGQPS